MLNLKSHFINTYGKMLLQDWVSMMRLIQRQTQRIASAIRAADTDHIELKDVLTEPQINDAFNGPLQQFYRQHLLAYSAIKRVETALNVTKNELFKDSDSMAENQHFSVPAALLNRIELSDLKQLLHSLNTLMETHYHEWEKNVSDWTALLLEKLKQNPTLSDLEITTFVINEPISELHDRFVDLKTELPEFSKSPFGFSQYFTLKAVFVIQSALARLQQPNDTKHVHIVLKPLHSEFKSIHKIEKTLLASHQKAIDELLLKIK